jgi:hypothetical protein
MSIYTLYVCMYIYIYIERERERKREKDSVNNYYHSSILWRTQKSAGSPKSQDHTAGK